MLPKIPKNATELLEQNFELAKTNRKHFKKFFARPMFKGIKQKHLRKWKNTKNFCMQDCELLHTRETF